MNLITNILVYPSNLTDNRQDCRCPWNEPFMLVCFDYTRDPETDEAIIKQAESEFIDFPDMEIIPVSVREILTRKGKVTTYFEPKVSIS